ncbi:probable rhamnogalacturonate lyase B [Argentina anserina]|uniref:probable rhamnogalacturonate lyase B n=1 Tax=Argentina anserina TaxID=57926 RepID=UPI0021764C4F|nr:probable rhamnogalacturonate lyase B [Potentilla anserina]
MQKAGRRSLKHWGWLVGTLATMLVLVVCLVGEKKYEKATPKTTLLLRKILQRYPRTELQGMKILEMPSERNFARPPYPRINMVTKNSSRTIVARTQYQRVSMLKSPTEIRLDNGFVQLTVSRPSGDVIGIKYKGSDNLLEHKNLRNNRGYWDVAWNRPGESIYYVDKLQATRFRVIMATADQVEISFVKTYNVSEQRRAPVVPLNVDKRYILRRGHSGFYAYAIFECLEGWPEVKMDQIRMVYKLQHDKFQYMALSDTRQTFMPKARDRKHGQQLAYPEAVRLTRPTNRAFIGQVDDKYQYSMEDKDNKVHGWISTDQSVGFWMITPSDEFRSAGPMKQGLTSHVGPTTLSMFLSTHYAGKQAGIELKRDEAWKKVFGPVFVYLNSAPRSKNSTGTLWNDAKEQMAEEVKRWPYNFTQSEDFPYSDQRGSVFGRLIVHDRCLTDSHISASSAYVGLAAPGEVGSWQKESKGYQFWTRADKQGHFLIKDVRPGNYSLYGWVPGILGDYKYEADIEIKPGSEIQLPNLTYEPPRNGPTLWEIGIPDRSAAEFYIPDPYPTLMNKLYINNHSDNRFRQYGLWKRYEELYPDHDLIYTIGVSDYRYDWFYAHVTRSFTYTGNEKYVGTTWEIQFELNSVMSRGNYTLQLALASATHSEIQVRFNTPSALQPQFSTGLIGGDNAIARHGIHGLYWFFSVNVPSSLLYEGTNIIYLTQSRGGVPFRGVMYDYIRLEGPSIRHPDT